MQAVLRNRGPTAGAAVLARSVLGASRGGARTGALACSTFSRDSYAIAHGTGEAEAEEESVDESQFRAFDEEDDRVRRELLEASLTYVHTHGWSLDAVVAAAKQLGLPPTAHGLLGGSSMDLIEAFMRASNRAAIEDLAKLPLDDMSVRDVLENGIRLRLQRVVPYLSSWPQAIAHGARPDRAPRVADVLGGYMDELWYVAGDRSTSIDWYARRAGLLSVYVATELHLLTDSSEGQTDTWSFLARRMSDADVAARGSEDFAAVGRAVCTGAGSLLSVLPSLVPGLVRPARPPRDEAPERAPASAPEAGESTAGEAERSDAASPRQPE